MSVLSWRWRSSGRRLIFSDLRTGFGFGSAIYLPLVLVSVLILAGCFPQRKEYEISFETGSLPESEWNKIYSQCIYEAAKAVVGETIGEIRVEKEEKLITLCVEAKNIRVIRRQIN